MIDGKDTEIKKTEALPSRDLESRKLSRYTAQNRLAGRSHIHTFREGSVCGGQEETTTQLRGFGRGSMEVRFHLAEAGLRVFQGKKTT